MLRFIKKRTDQLKFSQGNKRPPQADRRNESQVSTKQIRIKFNLFFRFLLLLIEIKTNRLCSYNDGVSRNEQRKVTHFNLLEPEATGKMA